MRESLRFNKDTENERATGQREEFNQEGHHFSTFFDENEDRSGEMYDPGTGKKYNNSKNIKPIGVSTISEEDLTEEHPIIQEMESDIAEQYLLKHDPTYLGKGKWKEDNKEVA